MAEDGVTPFTLLDELNAFWAEDNSLSQAMRPHAAVLEKQLKQIPLHSVAQLLLTTALARSNYEVFTFRTYPAEIKGGPAMSAYAMEAAILDQGGTSYYSQTLEMGARAFQSWVEDRLGEMENAIKAVRVALEAKP